MELTNHKERLLDLWVSGTGMVLPLLVVLAVVLVWPPFVQITLMVVGVVVIFGNRIALNDWARWRARRASRQLARPTRDHAEH